MRIIRPEQLEQLKKAYPNGTRVELIKMLVPDLFYHKKSRFPELNKSISNLFAQLRPPTSYNQS